MPQYRMTKEVGYDTSGTPQLDNKMLQVLANEVGQYFNCFCLYGFDSHGRPVKIGNISSPMEQLALIKFICDDMDSVPTLTMGDDNDAPENDDDED
jgi:hypothetical protein